jgi:hypothetical protein
MNRTKEETARLGLMVAGIVGAVVALGICAACCSGCGGESMPLPAADAAIDGAVDGAVDAGADVAADVATEADARACLICDPAIGWYDLCEAKVIGCPPPSKGGCCP